MMDISMSLGIKDKFTTYVDLAIGITNCVTLLAFKLLSFIDI